jgi:hypothetical protein
MGSENFGNPSLVERFLQCILSRHSLAQTEKLKP